MYNIGQSEVNLCPLAPPCSRIPLVQGGFIAYLAVVGSWFSIKYIEDFIAGNRTANHSVQIWVPLHCHLVV